MSERAMEHTPEPWGIYEFDGGMGLRSPKGEVVIPATMSVAHGDGDEDNAPTEMQAADVERVASRSTILPNHPDPAAAVAELVRTARRCLKYIDADMASHGVEPGSADELECQTLARAALAPWEGRP